ncbi:MAG: hypothetical protein V3W43_17485, partial [Desulfatiglandaceae bacterium]
EESGFDLRVQSFFCDLPPYHHPPLETPPKDVLPRITGTRNSKIVWPSLPMSGMRPERIHAQRTLL